MSSSKLTHLWKSYESSLDHVAHFSNGHRSGMHVHASRTTSSKKIVAAIFSLGALCAISAFVFLALLLRNRAFTPEASLTFSDRISFLLVFQSIYFAVAVIALAIKKLYLKHDQPIKDLLVLSTLILSVTPFSLLYSFQPLLFIANLLVITLTLFVGHKLTKVYSYSGFNFYLATCLGMIIGVTWGINYFFHIEVSLLTRLLLVGAMPLLVVAIPSGLLNLFEIYDIICRDHWRRPRHPVSEDASKYEPFVSIQVPTYSEPSDLVIETLNHLAKLDYPHYQVIVIDNNTKDPDLWRPVQAHCETLGHRFKFLHIEGIKGAKGGALNRIHSVIDPRATIIGVIDADYQPDPQFLKALVGHFKDPRIGFVQSPHDYREWKDSLFLTMCYWEYKIFFHTAMISLNERDAGITVGTMCLIRKEALERAGGWSEWCVTEDSELAIRIHDLGYSSVYVDKTLGRGLIPESFEGYKKQRYRWTAGPVQELRHHYKHFIGLSKQKSRFSLTQRLFHINHGFHNVLLAMNIPMMLLGIGLVASIIYHHEIIQVPFELWLTATITLLAAPMLTFVLYRVTVRATIPDIIGQTIAAKALAHVIFHAALRTTLTGNAQWNRTSKFKSTQSYLHALAATSEEIVIGLVLLVFIVTAYVVFPYSGLSLMLLIGLSYVTLDYFAAPLMAVIGVWSEGHERKRHAHLLQPEQT